MAMVLGKKNFEFRMSKKVAELTQVVHMLFTRNHEKEVEMVALKESYEHEISNVIDDARGKIERLELKVDELERERTASEQRLASSALLQNRLRELESQLAEEKTESQNSRDLLIQAQKDLQNLRQAQVDDLASRRKELDDKEREIQRGKTRIANLEQEIRDKTSLLDSKSELLRTHEKLRKELDHMRVALQGSEKVKDELMNKNRNLETDVKTLKRELAKKLSERNSNKTPVPVSNGYSMNHDEEVEKLRRELARYRMELSNRENNFNRVFSERQPVTTTRGPSARRAGTAAAPAGATGGGVRAPTQQSWQQQQQQQQQGETGDGYTGRRRGSRQPGSEYYTEEELREIPGTPKSSTTASSSFSRSQSLRSALSSNSDRLPQLDRLGALAKPKLPKEILANKR